MSKLHAIKLILKNEHYVVITPGGNSSCSPKWSDREFWNKSRLVFNSLDKLSKKETQRSLGNE